MQIDDISLDCFGSSTRLAMTKRVEGDPSTAVGMTSAGDGLWVPSRILRAGLPGMTDGGGRFLHALRLVGMTRC